MQDERTSAMVTHRVRRYLRQAEILRQIHSDKAFRVERANRWYTILTVLIALLLTLLGFAGPTRIATIFAPSITVNVDALQAILNWAILGIIVLTMLGLIYRFGERSAQHHRSIEKLTEFIRDSEDLAEAAVSGATLLTVTDLDRFRERYKGIAAALPASTDREYLRSKERYKAKLRKSAAANAPVKRIHTWTGLPDGFVNSSQGDRLLELLAEPARLDVLMTVQKQLGASFWIVGGFVRDPVWDELSKHTISTPLEDIDVVYFDPGSPITDDAAFARKLVSASPNQMWSVVNEAHAHARGNDEAYESLVDAVARFPESASAVAVQLNEESALRILAPYGLDDLFSGVVQKSEKASPNQFEARVLAKQWTSKWPNLHVKSPAEQLRDDPQQLAGAVGPDATGK